MQFEQDQIREDGMIRLKSARASAHSTSAAEPVFMRPLVPVALSLLGGMLAGAGLPGYFGTIGVLFLLTTAGHIRYVLCRRCALFLPLLLCAAAGYLSIQPWLGRELPPDHVSRYAGAGKWQVGGVVDEPPEGTDMRRQFTLRADHLYRGQRAIAVRGKIRVSVRGETERLHRGDRVTVSGHLHAIRSFCNPDGFAYERYMALQGVHARLYTEAERMRIEPAGHLGWRGRVDEIRRNLALRMDRALGDFPPASVHLLQALTLGERGGLDEELKEAFSRAGVSHVLAISGLHVGMVAVAAFAFFSRLLVWMPALRERGWVRRSAALLSLLPIVGYGLLAGLSPSTQRAVLMAAVFLLTFWIGRPHDWLNALAAAALVILMVAPPALMSVSFQLSFAAVLAILLGMRTLPFPTAQPADPLWRRWGGRGIAFLGVSLLAVWGTAPLVMRYFNQVCWVGPLSNLLVVPLVGFWVVPAGLLGILCTPFGAGVSGVCWKAAAFGLNVIVAWVQAIAGFDFAASSVVTPTLLEMALFYLLTATLFLWKHRSLRIAGLAVVIAAGAADAGYWLARRFTGRQMTVTAVDVGQGSANVLQLPGGYTVLVDGGGFSDNSAFDIGRAVLAPYLWSNKIKTIDLIILTHANSDHLNGLLFILRRFKVHRIWSNHESAPTAGYGQWQEIIAKRAIEHIAFDRLPLQTNYGPVRLEILGPLQDFLLRRAAEPWRDANNNSLVVRASWKELSFLFTGDIMVQAENELLRRHGAERLQSTIFFVPHHGSKSSSSTAFIQAVQPREGIIAAGWNNRFNFPDPAVLQRLEQAGCRVWRTDQCGAVTIRTDGIAYRMQTCQKKCP
ncbi:MAG: DNA internalization-related competence protein ComEC/Rec2 [Desulfobacteraceae bacterium]|nr:MAG: DNA internalization-related competence protein ComEC/Rec2 [Desulfobacteraceae bacterium]